MAAATDLITHIITQDAKDEQWLTYKAALINIKGVADSMLYALEGEDKNGEIEMMEQTFDAISYLMGDINDRQ